MTFNRSKASDLLNLLQAGRSFLLFGPRQTGKTTLMKEVFSHLPPERCLHRYFQLPSERQKIESDPEILRREVEAMGSTDPIYLFIDEIQKVPKVMDVLQYLIDQKKIVLGATGSSARKMKSFGVNWLPGRLRLESLSPLTWEETRWGADRLSELLRFGALPGILSEADSSQREQSLSAYAHLYLEEEVRMEALVRNVPRFAKFLRLAAFESGTSPNLSKIGGLVGLSHTTIREYFQILEDTLILHRLDAFGSGPGAVLRSPKYYFFDIGVRNAAADIGHSPGILTLQMGLLFEHFIILETFARFAGKAKLCFWRTKKGDEVDLVIERQGRLIPIEIKATENPSSEDFKGLEAFSSRYKIKEGYLVCRASRPQKHGSFLAVPWTELAERLV